MQNHYTLIYREEEREMFPTLHQFGVGSIPWSPLGQGILARPLESAQDTKRAMNDYVRKVYKSDSADEIVRRYVSNMKG